MHAGPLLSYILLTNRHELRMPFSFMFVVTSALPPRGVTKTSSLARCGGGREMDARITWRINIISESIYHSKLGVAQFESGVASVSSTLWEIKHTNPRTGQREILTHARGSNDLPVGTVNENVLM